MIWLSALALLAWLYLLLAHGRFWQSGPSLSLPAPGGPSLPDIDVVIPARDEAAGIEKALRSLLQQEYKGRVRIVVVDDQSTDGTGALARSVLDHGTVITGLPRPEGWSGKLWAVSQGLAQTTAPFILLTDADIVHGKRHLKVLVTKAEQDGLDLVSEMVELRCKSLAERALVPAFVYFFQMLFPFARVNDPMAHTAAAAGGTMLIRRRALERIGGIGAIRGALIDDVALAAAVKREGRIWLGHTHRAYSIRPYPGALDIWRMVARTAYVQLRFSPWVLAGTVVGLGLIWLLPPGVALFGHGVAQQIGAVAWVLSMLSFLSTLDRFGLMPFWAFGLPLIACFYMAATIGSAVDHHWGRGVQWKRRAYPGAGI